MFFWNSLAFLMIQQMLAGWSLVPLPFLKSAWTSGSSRFTYWWSLAWRILTITLLAMWDEYNCAVVWAFFAIAFLSNWNVSWPFHSRSVATAEFSKFADILSAALSQHHLLGFETVQLEFQEKAMATHSSTLVWKSPWMEKLGRLQSMGSWRFGHN